MDKILIDTDVFMDFFFDRKPFAKYATELMNLCAEKQVQGWSRKKKQALIESRYSELPQLSKNYTQFGTSTSSVPDVVVEPVETTATKISQS